MKVSYELMMIVTPDVTEEERGTIITYVEDSIKGIEAEELKKEEMGTKKLAYPIQKKENGFYVLFKFVVEGTKLIELERKINLKNDKIIRYILVKQG